MSLSLRSSFLGLALTVFGAACVEKKPLGEGQACPCAPGWKCDTSVGKCRLDHQDASADFPKAPDTDLPKDANADFFPTDAKPCPPGQMLVYTRPGCGMAAQPVCGSGGDGCLRSACGCDGQTLDGCDYFGKPWSHLGACNGTDAPAEAPEGRVNCFPMERDLACDPTGDWTVRFFNPNALCGRGSIPDHHFTVLAEGGLFCIFSIDSDYRAINVSPNGCQLVASGSRRSGVNAQIFESWDLSLTVAGLGGTGTLAHHLQADAICNTSWDASGKRSALTDGGLVDGSPGDTDAMDASPAGPGRLLYTPCPGLGARDCSAVDRTIQLLCDGNLWTPISKCPEGGVCDTRPGPTLGLCVLEPDAGRAD